MRYTRHDLKQDKFAENVAEVVHQAAEHRKGLIQGVVIAAVVLALVVGGLWYYNYRNEQGRNALASAMSVYTAPVAPPGSADPQVTTFATEKDRADAARKAFYNVAERFGSTKSGKYATYMAALCEEQLGNQKGAEDQLKKVADSSNNELSALGKFALASLYRDMNRESDAVNLYKQIIDHPTTTVPKANAQLELADLYASKQPDESKKIYNQIMKDDAKSVGAEIAKQRLASMQ